jgi:hypothetical protein
LVRVQRDERAVPEALPQDEGVILVALEGDERGVNWIPVFNVL